MSRTNGPSGESGPRISVVTAFVWDGQRVLLSLRSERVSTFPGHWAAISGYLEGPNPAAWAVIEIEEETGIPRDRLTLLRAGPPLDAADAAGGRVFAVHPFLFAVAPGVTVRADWESRRLEWIAVQDVLQERLTPTVPRLYDVFRSVWPPPSAAEAIDAHLRLATDWLSRDRRLGAGTLARTAGREILKLAALCPADRFAAFHPQLGDAIAAMRQLRPSMVPLANLMDDLAQVLQQAGAKQAFLTVAEELIRNSEHTEERLARQVADRIPAGARIMTISYSGTVARVLRAAADRLARVWVCESRPLYEGRLLAAELHAAGIPVTLLTESQIAVLMPQVDLVLFGADTVIPERGVVNKAGSTLLALAARQAHKPVLVAAERLKCARNAGPAEPTLESGSPEEIWTECSAGVEISNVYFELVPRELITELILSP